MRLPIFGRSAITMNPLRIQAIAAFTLAVAVTAAFGEDRAIVPCEVMEKPMAAVASRKIEGVDCVSFCVKQVKEGAELDLEVAKFRIETGDGKTVMLKCEALASIDEADLTLFEKGEMGKGSSPVDSQGSAPVLRCQDCLGSSAPLR